ncbi:hypothetical protein NEHOM01_2520, partial [Nematocida homosporus]|uniref:uncharacterized protein n=1 Tax=Nematocida homosporus TaxID=1912981 RepID=UPI00221FCE9C
IRKGMLGMSLKLVLAWLCCVMVWLSVVLGSSDSSTNSDEMELKPSAEFRSRLAQTPLEDSSCVEEDNFHLYGLDNFNSEISEHQIPIIRAIITACLEVLGIKVQPLVGNRLIESRNPDGFIGWIFEINSIEDRTQMVEDMQVMTLIDYLDELKGIPGVRKVATIYRHQAMKIGTNSFHIPPTSGPTSTNPNEVSITYKQCLDVIEPLKKITSPEQIMIFGETTENEILDQLKLLLYLLRIADSPIIRIDWMDVSKVLFDAKSVDRFRPLLEDIPAKLKKRKLVIKVANACNRVFWDAFLDLLGEKYDIEVTFVKAYPVVPPNANST